MAVRGSSYVPRLQRFAPSVVDTTQFVFIGTRSKVYTVEFLFQHLQIVPSSVTQSSSFHQLLNHTLIFLLVGLRKCF